MAASLSMELNRFAEKLETVLQETPDRRRELHERLAERLQEEVRSTISQRIHDDHGTIRAWQESYVGSRGGYAAVRPISTPAGVEARNSPGAITNYLELGHKTRPAAPAPKEGDKKRTRKTPRKEWVDGYGFYSYTRAQSRSILLEESEAFMAGIVEQLRK